MMNNKRSHTERQIPAFELSLRKYQERSQWRCSSSGLGMQKLSTDLNITILILLRVFWTKIGKERDTQAVRQGMKKAEEEEEEEEKKVSKKFGSFSVLLFGAITKYRKTKD